VIDPQRQTADRRVQAIHQAGRVVSPVGVRPSENRRPSPRRALVHAQVRLEGHKPVSPQGIDHGDELFFAVPALDRDVRGPDLPSSFSHIGWDHTDNQMSEWHPWRDVNEVDEDSWIIQGPVRRSAIPWNRTQL
jgi:hypothetical protein